MDGWGLVIMDTAQVTVEDFIVSGHEEPGILLLGSAEATIQETDGKGSV